VGTAAASLYLYGYWTDNSEGRDDLITGAEAAGLASLANVGFKHAFGRLRPEQDAHDHDAFFRGGRSMFSGEVTPVFSFAAGVSEYFNNEWYVATPVYSLAFLDGFGRMGHDAHWFSDVVGSALLGAGTTELLLYLHRLPSGKRCPGTASIVPAASRADDCSEGVVVLKLEEPVRVIERLAAAAQRHRCKRRHKPKRLLRHRLASSRTFSPLLRPTA
jgi:membrane-associated phospholipid phosphatase